MKDQRAFTSRCQAVRFSINRRAPLLAILVDYRWVDSAV